MILPTKNLMMPASPRKERLLKLACLGILLLGPWSLTPGFAQEDDYLTEKEIVKLREEFPDSSARIELLTSFLQIRFQHTRQMKTDLVPLPAKAVPDDSTLKEKKKGKPKKEEAIPNSSNDVVDPEEELGPQSFLEWIRQYSACLEDIEMNLKELPARPVELKPMLKVMKKLNQDLGEQNGWVATITPMLKGVEQKTLKETGEILQDVTAEAGEYLQVLEMEQERLKQEKKKK